MNIFTTSLMTFGVLACVCACGSSEITVKTEAGQTRLQAISPEIIRVTKVPAGARFSRKESLCAVPVKNAPAFRVTRTEDCVIAELDGITAEVSRTTGEVIFRNASGILTREKTTSFSPVEVDGDMGYTVRQTFESPADESFFGLGQHQADEWDYKGRNEELYQYNTKISVPFVVSNKGYGILWDSYSFLRWGDPREYAQLGDVFKLYDKNGAEGALTGTYTAADGRTLVRRETSLSQEFLETPECLVVRGAPEGFAFDGSRVLYEGEIEPSESGLFNFYVYYAGYMRVYLDGRDCTGEIWRTAWNPNGRKFSAELEKGRRTPLRIEWEPDGGVSYCALRVLSPVPEEERGDMSWWGEMQDQIDYYIVAGDDADMVISGYRTITGKAQVMPKWAMGYWQSRERYSSQDQITGTVAEFRRRGIPLDNIVQDWQYWKDDQWGSHEFDPARYPDPKAMIDRVHGMDARFMISVWPKFYRNTEHFRQLDEKGWIYQTAIKDSVVDWLGYEQSFYDAYSEGARKMFWDQMNDKLYPLGIDAWWMDASEPNIHDCTDMDYRKALCGPTALGTSTEYFNAYALMNAQAIYEGQRSVNPDARVFLLTRNGFAGLQRYSTVSWSGDIGTRWEDMKAQISAGLNFSISGIPFWGQDIGGFSVEKRFMEAQSAYNNTGKITPDLLEWREMQARWHEWGVFCPLYRAHGQWPEREPYNIAPEGSEAYEAIVAADRLRYELMPYIYTMAGRVHFDDYTIMRPLVMDFAGDRTAEGISDQFMFGDAFMVCPVYSYGAREREVYLPEGLWYDWYEGGAPVRGGVSFAADAPFSHVPVYVRAGSIVPTAANLQSTADYDGDDLIVKVFAGRDGEYRLYEDDGLTYAYENGGYSWVPMRWHDADCVLEICAVEGGFDGMAEEKDIIVELHDVDGSIILKSVEYKGDDMMVTL